MARRRDKALRTQKIAVGAFGVLVLGLVGYLFWLVLSEAPSGEFVEGEHYFLIENPARTSGERVEVTEFFSYACIHCFNFDPILEDWVEDNAAQIAFRRSPVFTNEPWRVLATHFYTTLELGNFEEVHTAFFRELHVASRQLLTRDAIARWIDGRDVTEERYIEMYGSQRVRARMTAADRLQRQLQVSTVPTVVIAGKYRVRTTSEIGPKRMLEIMKHLVDKELAERQPAG